MKTCDCCGDQTPDTGRLLEWCPACRAAGCIRLNPIESGDVKRGATCPLVMKRGTLKSGSAWLAVRVRRAPPNVWCGTCDLAFTVPGGCAACYPVKAQLGSMPMLEVVAKVEDGR